MRTVDRVADYLTEELGLSRDKAEIVRYGLLSSYATALNLLAIAALAAALGVLKEALCAAFTVAAFKKVSGGAHCSSLYGCIIIGSVTTSLIGIAGTFLWPVLSASPSLAVLPSLVALLAVYSYAPAAVPQKPINSPRQRLVLRILSFIVVGLWGTLGIALFRIGSGHYLSLYASGSLGLLWQGFALTPSGFAFMRKLDPLFSRLFKL